MKTTRLRTHSALLSLTGFLFGCSGIPEGGLTETEPEQVTGNVLAEVRLSDTHRVQFIEDTAGELVLQESGHIDEIDTRLDLESLQGLTFSEKYRTLAQRVAKPDGAAVTSLVAAEQRSALVARDRIIAAPPERSEDVSGEQRARAPGPAGQMTETPGVRVQAIDYTADAKWWKDNFCSSTGADGVWCPTNVGWAKGGWEPTMYFESVCLAAHSTSGALHWTEVWNGSAWDREYSQTLSARTWTRRVHEVNSTRRGGCEGLSPNPHVDYAVRIRWATPTFVADSNFPSDRSIELANGIQGVTHDDTHWYFTAAKTVFGTESRIWKVPLTSDLRNMSSWVANPWDGILNHFGDSVHVNGRIYVPLEPADGSATRGAFGVFDSNLNAIGRAYLPSESPQNSGSGGPASWIAYNPKDGFFYSSRYHTTQLHRYKIQISSIEPRVRVTYHDSIQIRDLNGNAVSAFGYIQGGKFSASGKLYLTRWLAEGGIYVIDPINGRNQAKIRVNYDKSDDEELEGLDIFDTTNEGTPHISSQVHVLMFQEELHSNDDLYFKHFDVADFGKL